MIDQADVGVILQHLLQQRLDELVEVVNLLELAPAVLVHLPVARENVQLFQQLDRLARLYFVHFLHLWRFLFSFARN